jgi:hypothetical protein
MAGVIAAGHPLTAEAGAEVLRKGGNAVDAAICAVLASFATESPLTGFGAGGFMMVHRGGETVLLDFFVAAPGRDGIERGAELVPVPVHFDAETVQTFYVGPASCGVPGTAAGLEEALRRFGSAPLADLVEAGVRLAREGAPVNAEQAYILDILEPIHARLEGTRELYAPDGRTLREGELFRFAELATALERFGAEGAEPFCGGEIAAALSDHVVEHGGTLGRGDFAAYEAIERRPIRAAFRGTEVLTNPPPSSGGILIAYCLGLLERLGERSGPEQLVAAMGAANDARGEAFAEALYGDPQQHAGRGGPQPTRLPRDPSRPAGAVDDGADRGAARRRDRAWPRQRRIEPDPLGDPANDREGGRAGDGRRRGGAGAAPALRAGRRPGRAWHRRGGAGADRGPRHPGPAPSRDQPLLRRHPGGRARTGQWRAQRRRRPSPWR